MDLCVQKQKEIAERGRLNTALRIEEQMDNQMRWYAERPGRTLMSTCKSIAGLSEPEDEDDDRTHGVEESPVSAHVPAARVYPQWFWARLSLAQISSRRCSSGARNRLGLPCRPSCSPVPLCIPAETMEIVCVCRSAHPVLPNFGPVGERRNGSPGLGPTGTVDFIARVTRHLRSGRILRVLAFLPGFQAYNTSVLRIACGHRIHVVRVEDHSRLCTLSASAALHGTRVVRANPLRLSMSRDSTVKSGPYPSPPLTCYALGRGRIWVRLFAHHDLGCAHHHPACVFRGLFVASSKYHPLPVYTQLCWMHFLSRVVHTRNFLALMTEFRIRSDYGQIRRTS
ncbi:hypothetical protein B0H10DRAFT_2217648 [Mycena sp. CBHHK59/15]|nr:hypothetical protein B0H10DRAFT_2242157 [Mycena sp. CBHHK59/15]KAJ6618518.1 hypothetical protein B0H10DRAFT_2217648 [Mycena sp. CBHHK59/15]